MLEKSVISQRANLCFSCSTVMIFALTYLKIQNIMQNNITKVVREYLNVITPVASIFIVVAKGRVHD